MSIAIDKSSIPKGALVQMKEKCKVQGKASEYNKTSIPTFRVYKEDTETIYVPLGLYRQYFSQFPTSASDYPSVKLPLKGTLYTPETDPEGKSRDQVGIVANATKALLDHHSVFLSASPGYGKCFGKGTPILVRDRGSIPVEAINVGDLLYGLNGHFTSVVSLARGRETMYKIETSPYESFVCNESHILTLYRVPKRGQTSLNSEYRSIRIVDVPVGIYVNMSPEERDHHLVLYKSLHGKSLYTVSLDSDEDFGRNLGESISSDIQYDQCSDRLKTVLRYSEFTREYVFWTLIVRLFEPVPDSSGQYFYYSTNPENLADLVRLTRSLGYAVKYITPESIIIRGCKRVYHFFQSPKIQILSEGDYYGFTLSGDPRFIMGSFVVGHNTTMGVHLAVKMGHPTALLCHIDGVRRQWVPAINRITNNQAIVQMVEGNQKINPKAHFYIIGIEKASKYTLDDFEHIGTVIIDEAHVSTRKAFTDVLLMFQPRYLIGLSATPDRPDGLDSIFPLYFPVFIEKYEKKSYTVIKIKTRFKPEIAYTNVGGRLTLDWATVTRSIEDNLDRQKFIAQLVSQYPKDKILVLCKSVSLTQGIYDLVSAKEKASLFFKTKKVYDKTARVTCCGMKKGGVGMDDPALTMEILASSAKDVRQYVGRIRQNHGTIIDIVDNHPVFEKHWKLRREFYERSTMDEQGIPTVKIIEKSGSGSGHGTETGVGVGQPSIRQYLDPI